VGRPGLSDAGFDLLGGLLALDPARRITAKAAEQHPWCARGQMRAAALRLGLNRVERATAHALRGRSPQSLSLSH